MRNIPHKICLEGCKMKKKILSIVLTGLMMLSLSACGNSSNSDNGSATPDNQEQEQEPMSEALESRGVWFRVSGKETIAKDDSVNGISTFEDGMVTAYALNNLGYTIGDFKGMSDDEILDEVAEYKVDGTPIKYTLAGTTDDTGNIIIEENIVIDSSVSTMLETGGKWWDNNYDYSPCTNGYTIYDDIYNGFRYASNKVDSDYVYLVTRIDGTPAPQPFVLDSVDTEGIEVD